MKNFGMIINKNTTGVQKENPFWMIEILRKAILPVLLLMSSVAFCQTDKSAFDYIYNNITQKNFFKARELFAGNKKRLAVEERYFVKAILYNAFNKPKESDQKIVELGTLKRKLADSLLLKIWRIKEDNSMKQYNYKEAKNAVQVAMNQYSALLTEEEKTDMKNNLKIWTALENEPQQKVVMNGDTRMKMEIDKANLKNLQVSVGGDTMNFIFDTGANISTISASAAKRLKMKIIPADIDVDAITGISVKADLAVCKKLILGNVTVENAVFLVFADTALGFPQMNYQINGILGFPVIEALKEVQLTQDNYFIVPEKETIMNTSSNLAIDRLSPLIYIDGKHFSFDTGADQTMLYASFYQENKKEIEKQYQVVKINMGGAGGKVEYDGFKINHTFHIVGKQISLKNIGVLKDKINKETVYGNIGQDVIRQFNKMTLNFDQMFIKFD